MLGHPHFDVLIIGAGLSGIGAAWHLQHFCPDRSYAILESRAAMGGTWDLFRYPGIRSDSDMYTLGYRFRPWRDAKAIADGPAIKRYIEETAREHGIDQKIRYGHRVVRAEWSSEEAHWKVQAEHDGVAVQITCGFLYCCTGYYDYEAGYTPDYPRMERYAGRFVHPQHWPSDLDYSGKRVVVIGSGATAVTLVPAMSMGPGAAAHVTMLQRSPSYIAELPSQDIIADTLRRVLPSQAAYAITRWKNVLMSMFFFLLARAAPGIFSRGLRKKARAALGAEYDVDKHFTPRYRPWDERLCIIPDGDLFTALREKRASIATDEIESFTPTGIQLKSGEHLDADIVVSATGLALKLVGGMALVVDGTPVDIPRAMTYKGLMYSGVPNLASAFGYTNASWTLKCDLMAEHVCRLLNYMKEHGYVQCMPVRDDSVGEQPVLNFTSGYVQRALPNLPKQGTRSPWRVHQNYLKDLVAFRHGRVDDPALEFRRRK